MADLLILSCAHHEWPQRASNSACFQEDMIPASRAHAEHCVHDRADLAGQTLGAAWSVT